MSRSREELKEIARQILDYRRNDHFQLMSSLSPKELAELTPLIREVSEEQIAKDRAEHEAFMKKEREFDRETKKFIEDVARNVLGLTSPDDVLIKEGEGNPE